MEVNKSENSSFGSGWADVATLSYCCWLTVNNDSWDLLHCSRGNRSGVQKSAQLKKSSNFSEPQHDVSRFKSTSAPSGRLVAKSKLTNVFGCYSNLYAIVD